MPILGLAFSFYVSGSQSYFEGEARSNVMVRSPCLSVILVLEFSDRGISQIGSCPNVVTVSVFQRGKAGVRCRVSGSIM